MLKSTNAFSAVLSLLMIKHYWVTYLTVSSNSGNYYLILGRMIRKLLRKFALWARVPEHTLSFFHLGERK